jgi:hypothetical protein
MKRSSSIAQLADDPQQALDTEHLRHVPSMKWNYQDDVLATSMMLATISDEKCLRRPARSGSIGSNVSTGNLSRCNSSRSSLSGWGSTTSRKSYKLDLCSLAGGDSSADHHHHHDKSTEAANSGRNRESCDERTSVAGDTAEDSWGYFVDSNV